MQWLIWVVGWNKFFGGGIKLYKRKSQKFFEKLGWPEDC